MRWWAMKPMPSTASIWPRRSACRAARQNGLR
jgi:hypothetical protein